MTTGSGAAQYPGRVAELRNGAPEAGPSPWNIANALTALRVLLVPLFVWLLLVHERLDEPGWRWWALITFVVAMLTDKIDGEIARRHGLETRFGRIADPIADKALTGAAFIGLSLLGELPWWVTVVVLVRELGITALRFAVARHGMLPVSRGGKLKTTVQGVALAMAIATTTNPLGPVPEIVMGAAVVITVVTGLDYVREALRLRTRNPARGDAR